MQVTQRSRDARADLETGDLDAALNAMEEIIATAEQNLRCAHMAPAMQLALITTLLNDCKAAPDRSIDQYMRIRALNYRIELVLQGRRRGASASGQAFSTHSEG
jgi:hypothetical protein